MPYRFIRHKRLTCANSAGTAVSTLRMRGPRVTGSNPIPWNFSNSKCTHPPSGPMARSLGPCMGHGENSYINLEAVGWAMNLDG